MKNLAKPNEQGGYVALILVLIVSAASLAIALNLLSSGADSQRSLLVSQQSVQARSLASACAEEALQQIHNSTSFTGTSSLTLGAGTCTYTVANSGGNSRTIDASGVVGNVTRKLKVAATIQTSNIKITSWQDSI